MTTKRKLLVAEHRDLILAGLRRYFEGTVFEMVAEARSGRGILRQIRAQQPDILLLGNARGDSVIAHLQRVRGRYPDLPVLVFSVDDNPTYLARSLAWGANGYVSEGVGREELIEAFDLLARGKSAWRADQLDPFTAIPPAAESEKPHFTPRERQVLRQLSYGLPNREIAMILQISVETVKEHVASIRQKLGVNDRTRAAIWAIRHGLG